MKKFYCDIEGYDRPQIVLAKSKEDIVFYFGSMLRYIEPYKLNVPHDLVVD